MAALWEVPTPQVGDLRQIRAELLEDVLAQETEQWRKSLQWDFRPSADLVRRFVQMHALSGYSLLVSGRPVGYTYFVCEERKGLIGDLFVMENYRTAESEKLLLGAALRNLMANGYVRRVESQLLMLETASPETLPANAYLQTFLRNFMVMDLVAVAELPARAGKQKLAFENWMEFRQEEAAHLIAAAYHGHVDSNINDQYRSVNGARHFLLNIVQYPGCGTFFQPASWIAFDAVTRRACGLCLASLVASDVGHITQICAAPEAQGTGVGYELLRRALLSLSKHGCKSATLTVTASNAKAVKLYEDVGFRTMKQFSACVWEGF